MDERVKRAALGALRRLGSSPPVGQDAGGALRLDALSLAQFSSLAYFQAEDPLVASVAQALKEGRPVYLNRPELEQRLGLDRYPPRLQEQFARWFSRISSYGVHLDQGPEASSPPLPQTRAPEVPTSPPAPDAIPAPEREVLAEILGEACSADRPCVLEPGKVCCGSGRCKALGF